MLKFWTLRILPVKRRQSQSPTSATGFGHFECWQSMRKIGSGLVIYLPHHNRHNGKSHNLKLLVSVVSEVKLSWYCLMRFPSFLSWLAKIPVDPLSPKVISRMYLTTARWTVEKGALLGAQSFFFQKMGEHVTVQEWCISKSTTMGNMIHSNWACFF